jgi:hypothetical protein
MYVCMYVCKFVCVPVRSSVRLCVSLYVCLFVCVSIYLSVCLTHLSYPCPPPSLPSSHFPLSPIPLFPSHSSLPLPTCFSCSYYTLTSTPPLSPRLPSPVGLGGAVPNIDMINVNCAILDSMTLQLSGMTGVVILIHVRRMLCVRPAMH